MKLPRKVKKQLDRKSKDDAEPAEDDDEERL